MAKKTKSTKKHRLKYAQPTSANQSVAQEAAVSPDLSTSQPSATGSRSTLAGRDYRFVTRDLRRLGSYAISLVLLELVLWILMSHTSLGSMVYSWFQV